MNTENIKHIFQSQFDYRIYCNEIVRNIFGCSDVNVRPELLDTTAEGDLIHYIGRMTDSEGRELGFFYTRVAEGSDVRRKRVGLRKLIAPYLKYDVDAAIAIFDDGQHWRLSYICDMKEGTTSAKRFSYVLGGEGQYKTPQERFERISNLRGNYKLQNIEDAFSVEALSKEFFDEYHRHYDRIVAELERQGNTGAFYHDYVKKMMGRIVFLHFLQKKGWLNSNQYFLRDLFFMQPLDLQSDFLEQVLEPLFFGIFNTENEKRKALFAQRGWNIDLLNEWSELPYLNGGLFEEDDVDKLNVKLPASLFEDLFGFLASYNFTVDENDPDDAEIGVDPEMLGKIFESLLEDNKAKGAFYTPKEIVRYMCKESLIAYLSSKVDGGLTDAVRQFVEHHELPEELQPCREAIIIALREVKICDPAIGSGAFPMGLLNELWRCREAVEGDSRERVALKKEIIENNVYGVDIEKGAIDIARLRFWLSIVVDAETPEPLPNFDYKFMQGNSLIESFEGHDLSSMLSETRQRRGGKVSAIQYGMNFGDKETRQNLQLLLKQYFSITDHKKKEEYRSQIDDTVKAYILQQGLPYATEQRLQTICTYANQDFFLWHTWFKDIFDKGGFDIVIGNPPYIQLQANDGELADLYAPLNYKSYCRTGDIYALFYEKGEQLLRRCGLLCFITSNGWMRSKYGDDLRAFLARCTNPTLLIDFNQMRLFDNAVVETNILIFSKSTNMHECWSCSFMNNKKEDVLDNLTKSVIQKGCECRFTDNGSWTISEKIEQQTKNHVEQIGVLLGEWPVDIYRGITTGCNAGFIISSDIRRQIYASASLIERSILDNTIFPIIQGRNLKKYTCVFNDKYMIVTPKGYDIEKTPKLKEYMMTHFTELSCKSGTNKWFELQASPSDKMLSNLHKEKILWGEISDKAKFTYDDGSYFAEATTFFMTTNRQNVSLKYLLAILNSKLSEWYFHKIATTTGMGTNRWKKYKLEQLPVAEPTPIQRKTIEMLVDRILEMKSVNIFADISAIENEIDQIVYQLYNLTPEEIAIIEQQ